jgi:hypothetical protein
MERKFVQPDAFFWFGVFGALTFFFFLGAWLFSEVAQVRQVRKEGMES